MITKEERIVELENEIKVAETNLINEIVGFIPEDNEEPIYSYKTHNSYHRMIDIVLAIPCACGGFLDGYDIHVRLNNPRHKDYEKYTMVEISNSSMGYSNGYDSNKQSEFEMLTKLFQMNNYIQTLAVKYFKLYNNNISQIKSNK